MLFSANIRLKNTQKNRPLAERQKSTVAFFSSKNPRRLFFIVYIIDYFILFVNDFCLFSKEFHLSDIFFLAKIVKINALKTNNHTQSFPQNPFAGTLRG